MIKINDWIVSFTSEAKPKSFFNEMRFKKSASDV